MNLKKINESINKIINEAYQKLEGITYFNCDIKYPDENVETVELPLYVKQDVNIGTYDSNIHGVEPQYAVGGWTGDGNLDLSDLESFKLLTDEDQTYDIPEVYGVTDDAKMMGTNEYGTKVTIFIPKGTKLLKVNKEGSKYDHSTLETDDIDLDEPEYYYGEE